VAPDGVFGIEIVLYIYHHFRTMRFKVILEAAEEGGYVIYVPSLPGCVSQGETREEAVENIKEAIEVYLDTDEAQVAAETQLKETGIVK
jgi:predicted RNase H-like HicB family nuclease